MPIVRRVGLLVAVCMVIGGLSCGAAAPGGAARVTAEGQEGSSNDTGSPSFVEAANEEPDCPEVGLDVLFLIDNSGSMNGGSGNDPSGLRYAAAKVFVDRMRQQDRAGPVHWADNASAGSLTTLDTPARRTQVKALIDSPTISGGTNISSAVAQATSILSQSPAGRARIAILISDGGGAGDYDPALTPPAAAAGLNIYTVGIGQAYTPHMQGIASGTGATYTYLDDPADLSPLYDQIATEVLGESAGTAECAPVVPSEYFGPNGALIHQCPCQGSAGEPVDTRTGNTWEPLPGLVIPGRGPGLRFEMLYNSYLSDVRGAIGNGWSTTVDMRLEVVSASEIEVHHEGGSTVSFFDDGAGGWEAPGRFDAALVENTDGSFTYTRAKVERFRFAADGRLLVISDLNGYETTFTYPTGSDEVDYIEDEAGRRLDVTWTGGLVTDIADTRPAGEGGARHLTFTYETDGDLATYTEVGGGVWKLGYDGSHRLLSKLSPRHTDPNLALRNTYDTVGRVLTQTDAIGRVTTFAYDTPGVGATRITFPDGDVRIDSYTDGLRTGITYAAGTPEAYAVAYTYDPVTLAPKTKVDGRGKTWQFNYDGEGRKTVEVDPVNRVQTWEYNALDQVTKHSVNHNLIGSPASWVSTEHVYDAAGNLELTREAAGTAVEAVTDYVYGDSSHPGDLTSMVDPRGKTWSLEYHSTRGDLVAVVDPLGNRTTYATSTLGWLMSSVAPKGNASGASAADYRTTYTRDAHGRERTRTNGLGDKVETTYDANGNVSQVRSDLGTGDTSAEVVGYLYDAADQLSWRSQSGRSTFYWYREDGALEQFRDANGEDWAYGYDSAGRLISTTDPSSQVTSYGYDGQGNVTWRQQPVPGATCTAATKVGCTTYTYDSAGQLTGVDNSDATPDITGITHDGAGRRTSATIAGATETWSWDAKSHLTARTDRNGRTTTYGWDDANNVTSIGYPGQTTPVLRSYDDAGRLASTTDTAGRVSTFDHDANGNWTDTTFPTSSGNTDERVYDRADRIIEVIWRKGSTVLGSVASPRDNEGLVTATTPTGIPDTDPHAYSYDQFDRLTGVDSEALAYDQVGNLTVTEDGTLQVRDPASQLCWTSPTATTGSCSTPSTDATTYTYDDRGNRTNRTTDKGVSTSYAYDLDNRLVTTTETGPAPITAMDGTPITGDFDGDGKEDVLWYRPSTGVDWAWWGASREVFGRRATAFSVNGTYTPLSGDFDGDGNGDILWYGAGSAPDSMWFGNGDRTFDTVTVTVNNTYTPVTGDFDGDDHDDVYWYGPGSAADSIWWGGPDVDTSSSNFVTQSVSRAGSYTPVAGDIDGNGGDDIFWQGPGTDDVVYFSALGRNSWLSRTHGVSGTYTQTIGDVDGDDKGDVVFTSSGSDTVWWGADVNTFGSGSQKSLSVASTLTVPFTGNFDGAGGDELFLYAPAATGDTVWWAAARTDFGTNALTLGLTSDPYPTTYRYGTDGLRTGKTVNHLSTTEFTWDLSGGIPMLLAQHRGASSTLIVYGPGGTPLYQYDPASPLNRVTYHQDHLGSTRMTTNIFGDVFSTHSYDAYGNVESSTNDGILLTWAGEYRDAETGLYYLRSRHYDPKTGSFITRDPLMPATEEPYGYAMSNPTNGTDPTGLGCLFGDSGDDGCFGASIIENPIVQSVAVVGACTFGGPVGCVAANAAVVGINAIDRYDSEEGFTWEYAAHVGVDITLAAVQLRSLKGVSGTYAMLDDMGNPVFSSIIRDGIELPASVIARQYLAPNTVVAGLSYFAGGVWHNVIDMDC